VRRRNALEAIDALFPKEVSWMHCDIAEMRLSLFNLFLIEFLDLHASCFFYFSHAYETRFHLCLYEPLLLTFILSIFRCCAELFLRFCLCLFAFIAGARHCLCKSRRHWTIESQYCWTQGPVFIMGAGGKHSSKI
jgi:hypothetical protein